MKFDPQKHHRRSIRLKKYDYAQPRAYFITIVTFRRECLFGGIVDGETPQGGSVQLNDVGKIADECWRLIPDHFANVELGSHVVMPNHLHGIIVINDEKIGMATNSSPSVGARHASPLPPHGVKPKSIGAIVGSYKSAVTRRIARELNATGIWQRNYHEHVIRDDREMGRITRYIESNPSRWTEDEENPLKP